MTAAQLEILNLVADGKLTKEEATKKLTGPQRGEYKGSTILTLNPGQQFPFSFGIAKAKLIVEHFDAIKAFADEEK